MDWTKQQGPGGWRGTVEMLIVVLGILAALWIITRPFTG